MSSLRRLELEAWSLQLGASGRLPFLILISGCIELRLAGLLLRAQSYNSQDSRALFPSFIVSAGPWTMIQGPFTLIPFGIKALGDQSMVWQSYRSENHKTRSKLDPILSFIHCQACCLLLAACGFFYFLTWTISGPGQAYYMTIISDPRSMRYVVFYTTW